MLLSTYLPVLFPSQHSLCSLNLPSPPALWGLYAPCTGTSYLSFMIQFKCYLFKEPSLISNLHYPTPTLCHSHPLFASLYNTYQCLEISQFAFSLLSHVSHHQRVTSSRNVPVLIMVRPPATGMALGTKQRENEYLFHELSFRHMQTFNFLFIYFWLCHVAYGSLIP